jgi:D-inositol-3-phosphate glycosyltransferase
MPGRQLRMAMLSAHSCPVGNLGAKDTGGMSVYIRELAHELGRRGHLVDIYTRVHDPTDPPVVDLGRNVRLIHLTAGGSEEIDKLAVYTYLPDFTRSLEDFREHRSLRYDLVFSHYWLSGQVGKYLQHSWDVPHIMMFHTLAAVKNAIGIGEREPELRIEAERDLAQNCHRIIAPTDREREHLILHYGALPEKIGVVPCGVNLRRFRPVDKKSARQQLGFGDDKIVLFVGRIEPLKGIDQLLKSVPYLQSIQELRVVIIGGDEGSRHEIERLRELSCNLHIQDSVTFLGLVKHERLPYFYSAADVCVVPSYYESFGLTALESLACGIPVVATDVGDLKRIIGQGEAGYVVTDNTPRHLADRIALLLSRPSPDMKSALSIRASVGRFSWSRIADAAVEECRVALADYPALVP